MYPINGRRNITLRFGTWNIGTLTGKSFELVDVLKKRRIDVACIQETRWKGEKAREIRGYKLWYSGLVKGLNGVGIMVEEQHVQGVVEVKRIDDRLMKLSLVVGREIIHVICGYAPHVGLAITEKIKFWENLHMVIREIPNDQKIFIGGDFNGHVGEGADGYQGIHGGYGFGTRNDSGTDLLDFASAHDLMVVNTFFRKRDDHKITYHSGERKTQIDYVLVRMVDRRGCTDCKVFPKESMVLQHRLLVLDVSWRNRVRDRRRVERERILWKNLKGDKATNFQNEIIPVCLREREGDVDHLWATVAIKIREKAREILGVRTGTRKMDRESWWWTEDVQISVKAKHEALKKLRGTTDNQEHVQLREEYRRAKKEAKAAVTNAKNKAYEEMYKRLDTKVGEHEMYKLAKARARRTRDVDVVTHIKGVDGRTLVLEREIKDRWETYFNTLFNQTSNGNISLGNKAITRITGRHCDVARISHEEVKQALRRMGTSKAVGPDQIPIEVWRSLGEIGVGWLTNLFNNIMSTGKMPEDWRSSVVVPVYKNKGDVQECGNYRGIKLLSHTMKLWERVVE